MQLVVDPDFFEHNNIYPTFVAGTGGTAFVASSPLYFPTATISGAFSGNGYYISSAIGSDHLSSAASSSGTAPGYEGYDNTASFVGIADFGPNIGNGGLLISARTRIQVEADLNVRSWYTSDGSPDAYRYIASVDIYYLDQRISLSTINPGWASLQEHVSLSIENNSDTSMLADLVFQTQVSGGGIVTISSIPEPGRLALIALGLPIIIGSRSARRSGYFNKQ